MPVVDVVALAAVEGPHLQPLRPHLQPGVQPYAPTARERGITAAELLQGFVADLTGTLGNHGSDERRYARQWLGRVVWPRKAPTVAIR
jgi:hypothetical protein